MLVTECGKSSPDSKCHKMMQKHLVFQQLTEVSRSNESYMTWNTLSLCVCVCVYIYIYIYIYTCVCVCVVCEEYDYK